MTRRGVFLKLMLASSVCLLCYPAATAQNAQTDLSSLSLEDLASVEISSVSRKEEKLSTAAAAVYVISNQDIRRSGLTSIPELLRTVPGLDVMQIDANKWSVTTRGFSERYADKTLVLLDGRTLYSPLTSGVSWDVEETVLEDVERIEIVRGPGATLWGSNAVNGVINIITKQTKFTQGTLVSGMGSVQDRNSSTIRHGGSLGSRAHYRVYGKYLDRDGSVDASGGPSPDGWHDLRGGFRTDWNVSDTSNLTFQGDLYRGQAGTTVPGLISLTQALTGLLIDKTKIAGGNVLGRWTQTSTHLDTTLQGYFDLANRNEAGVLGEFRHTFDLDLTQRYLRGRSNDILWGGDFRSNTDRTVGSLNISFNPASRSTQLYGLFGQDELTLIPNKLKLTFGSKLEHNFYSGFSLQPNVRVIWLATERSSLWGAISRASESSSRTDADVRTNDSVNLDPNGTVVLSSTFGTAHLPPENVDAFETGFRLQPKRIITLDIASFYNQYSNRHTAEPGTPYFEDSLGPRHLLRPTYTRSNISGETHGLEVLARAKPAKEWDLSASYTIFEIHLHKSASSIDFTTGPDSEGSSPRNEYQLHSSLHLPHTIVLDTALYYVGELAAPHIKAYARVDLQVGWQPTRSLEVSAGGRNLFQAEHYEFGSGNLFQAEPIARSAYLRSTWRF